MTRHAVVPPAGASRVRIAITSPDILARIRQVFASKSLAVTIEHLPYVEVTVWPTARAASVRAADGDCLRAEYRLDVVEVVEQTAGPGCGVRAVSACSPGGTLSCREREVIGLVSHGARNSEIAARLNLSEKTVKNHLNRIFRKLGAASRVEAVLAWQQAVTTAGPVSVPAPRAAARRGLPGTP